MSTFNEMLAAASPCRMLLRVGGSISFAPEGEGAAAKVARHRYSSHARGSDATADQVTIVINTNQMSMVELMSSDNAGAPAYRSRVLQRVQGDGHRAPPSFVEEHLKRLIAKKIQPHFMIGSIHQLETVERLIRRGLYTGPLVLNHMALGGGYAGRNPADMLEFVRRCPDGAVLTIESLMRTVPPICTMAVALGLHVRVGVEDNLWRKKASVSLRCSRSNRWFASRASWDATSRPAKRRSVSTRSARTIRTRTKRWRSWAGRRIDARVSADFRCAHRSVARVAQDFYCCRGSLLTRFRVVINGLAPARATPALQDLTVAS